MKEIIETIFLYQIKKVNNTALERQLCITEINIIKEIEEVKLTNCFIDNFIKMYDKESLYKILVLIQKEIQKRSRDEINNMR